MRLDFNIVVIDDDLLDEDQKEEVLEIQVSLERHISSKGFKPNVHSFTGIEDFQKKIPADLENRIDFFLSDNNLGGSEQGVDFYLKLTETKIQDFVLYTRDAKATIVSSLVNKLQSTENPNLFSRFTFVEREGGDWFEQVEDVLDHVLSKREEINNLRGLFAQEMSKVENFLRAEINASSSSSLEKIIDDSHPKIIDLGMKRKLHKQRQRRNGIIHNDEKFCQTEKQWFLSYEEKAAGRLRERKVFENGFCDLRKQLSEVVSEVLK